MKHIGILFLSLIIIIFGPFTVCAEEYTVDGAEDVTRSLSDAAAEFFCEYDISPTSSDWTANINTQNVFKHIKNFLRDGANTPLKVGSGSIAIIILISLINAISGSSETSKSAVFVCGLSLTVYLSVQVYSAISASVSAIKGTCTFMLSFVPMYAGIVAVSGGVTTSVTMNALLLSATEVVSMLAAYIIVPVMSGYLAVSVCSSVSPLVMSNAVGESLKKIALWILSLISTVFLGVLSIQTAVNSSADSLALRTSKFIIGTTVPVAGQVLSEATSTVTASMQLLKSTAGIYGVVALCFFFLPLLAELLLWRVTMMVLTIISEILETGKSAGIFKAVDSMLSLLIGVILLVSALFIISLTVVINTGKAV